MASKKVARSAGGLAVGSAARPTRAATGPAGPRSGEAQAAKRIDAAPAPLVDGAPAPLVDGAPAPLVDGAPAPALPDVTTANVDAAPVPLVDGALMPSAAQDADVSSVVEAAPAARAARPGVVLPAVVTVLFLAAFAAFVVVNDLDDGALRLYGVFHNTDQLPPNETRLFIAVVFLGTGAALGLGTLLAGLLGGRLARAVAALAARPRATLAGLAGLALAATALVSWLVLQHAPTLLDEQLYIFQARLLRAGRLYTQLPDPLGPFREFYSVQARGIWTGIYPWGHAATLLAGLVLGFPQLVPHLCAPAAVLLVYALGRELFPGDRATPLLAAAVVATSPFLAFTCGTMHNSTTSMVLVTAGLAALVRGTRRSSLTYAALAGLCFGLGLHARPYNAVAVALPAGLTAFVLAVRLRRRPIRLALAFVAGVAPGVLLFLAINAAITGHLLASPAQLSMPTGMKVLGFGHGVPLGLHTPFSAFGQVATNLLRLCLWTSGSLAGGLGLLGLTLGLRRGWADLLLLVPVAGLFGFYYLFFTSPGSDTGPLYYLDLVPILALCLARTLVALGDRVPDPVAFRGWAAAGGLAALALALLTWWPLEGQAAHRVTDNTLLPFRVVDEQNVHKAIVWMNENWRQDSWTLPPPPPRPDLSDDVLFARYDDAWARETWEKYRRTRRFYRLYSLEDPPRLEPWAYQPWLMKTKK